MNTQLQKAIPVLPAPDLLAALAFYIDRLGFVEIIETDDYAGVERDGVEIHFWRCDDEELPKVSSCRLEVSAIEVLYAELKEAGVVHPNGALAQKPWGFLEFTVRDPFGNAIVFAQENDAAA